MIGVAPATTYALDWGLVVVVAAVVLVGAAVALHDHFLHRRVIREVKRRSQDDG